MKAIQVHTHTYTQGIARVLLFMQEESWTKGAYWRTAINLTSMLQAEIRRQQSAAFEASAKMDERLDEERAHFMRRLERLRGRDEVAGDDVLVLRRPKTSGLSTHERIQVEEELFEAEMDRRRGAEMEAITAQHPLAYLDLDAETALSALSLLPLLQANLRRLEMSNATMASAAKVEQPSAAEDGLTEQVKMEARPSTTAPSIFGQHRENSMLGSYLLPQGQGLTSWRRTRMVKLEPTAGTNNTHEAAATTATAPTPSASSPLWWVEKAKSVRGVSSFLQYALAQQLARAQTRLEVRRNTIAAILAQRGGDGADATLFTKVWDGDDGDISTSTIALEEELAFTEEMIERNEAEYRQRMLLLADPAQMEPLPTTEAAPTQTQASYNRIVHRRSASPPPALARDEQGNHFRGDVLRSSRAAYPLKPPRFLDVELPDEDEVEAARIAALLWPEELERRIPHVLSATTSFSPRRRKRRRRGGAEHSGAEEAENGTVPSWLQQRWPNAGVAALLHVDGVGEFMASSIVLPK